jgi:hypothetical protein
VLVEIEPAERLNEPLVVVPKVRIAVKHTRITSASMMAYSTAVGPASERTKRTILVLSRCMRISMFPLAKPALAWRQSASAAQNGLGEI